MTTSATHGLSDNRTRRVALVTLLIATGLPVIAILTADLRDVEVAPGLIDWVFVAAIVAVTLATYAALVPWAARRPNTAKIGLGLSVTALLLSVVAFWTMVPLILGSAGAWLAHLTRQDPASEAGSGLTMTAIVMGLLAAGASVVGYIATS